MSGVMAEPFGLVLIESMACGTPVIAFSRGAVPEIIENNVTGFVVETVEQAVAAVERLPELDRTKIRKRFDARFSDTRMTDAYLKIYASLAVCPLVTSRHIQIRRDVKILLKWSAQRQVNTTPCKLQARKLLNGNGLYELAALLRKWVI